MKKFLLSLLLIVAGAAAAKADVVSVEFLENNSTNGTETALKHNGGNKQPDGVSNWAVTKFPAKYQVAYGGFQDGKKDITAIEGAKKWYIEDLKWTDKAFQGIPSDGKAPVGSVSTRFAFEKPLSKIVVNITIPSLDGGFADGEVKVYASSVDGTFAAKDVVGTYQLGAKPMTTTNIEIPLSGTLPNMYYKVEFSGNPTPNAGVAVANMIRLFSINYFAKEDFAFNFLNAELFLNETANLVKPSGDKVPAPVAFEDKNNLVSVTDNGDSFLITPTKNGTGKATVTASWEENEYYLAGSTTFEVNVKPLELGDIEAKINGSLAIQENETYDVRSDENPITIYAKNATSIEVKEGDVVIKSTEGDTATFTPAGSSETKDYTITAKMDDEAVKTLSFRLAIHTDPIAWAPGIQDVEVTEFDSYVLTFGQPHPEVEFTIPDNANISIDKAKIGINEHSIVITANAPGVTKVTMTWLALGETFTSGKDTFEVMVVEKERAIYAPSFSALGSVIFTDNKMELSLGDAFPDLMFTSSNESVATVEKNGDKAVITRMGEGNTTITCTWDRDAAFLAPASPITFDLFVPAGKAIVNSGFENYNNINELPVVKAAKAPIDVEDFVKISFAITDTDPSAFYGQDIFSFEPVKGVQIYKIVFPVTTKVPGYFTLMSDEGNVKLENGVVTWEGPASKSNGHGIGDVKIKASSKIKVPYFEIYYTQELPNVHLSFESSSYNVDIKDGTFTALATAAQGEVVPDGKIAYESSNKSVAEVDNNGQVTLKAVGTTTISAFIPEDEKDYFSTVAKYTLTIYDPDKEVITADVFEGVTTLYNKLDWNDEHGVLFSAVFAKTVSGSMKLCQANGSNGSGIYVIDNSGAKRIKAIDIEFEDAGAGVKVYRRNAEYSEPSKNVRPVFSTTDNYDVMTESGSLESPDNCYTAFAIVPNEVGSNVLIKSVTVTYDGNETVKFAKVDVTTSVSIEPVELTVTQGHEDAQGEEIKEAIHYSFEVSAASNADKMLFSIDNVMDETIALDNGSVNFTVEYLPVPTKGMELHYCALDEMDKPIESTMGSQVLTFKHYPSDPVNGFSIDSHKLNLHYSYNKIEAGMTEDPDTHEPFHVDGWKDELITDRGLTEKEAAIQNAVRSNAIIADLVLSHVGISYPCIVKYNVNSVGPDASKGETGRRVNYVAKYNTATHEATVENYFSFPFNPWNNSVSYENQIKANYAAALDQLTTKDHNLNIVTQVYHTVVKDENGPVVTIKEKQQSESDKIGRKVIKAARAAASPVVEAVKSVRGGEPDQATKILSFDNASIDRNDGVVTGLENVLFDLPVFDGEVEYYNLQGVRILNPAKGQVVIRRQANGQVAKIRF